MKILVQNLILFFLLIFQIDADAQTWSELGGVNSFSPNGYIRTICSDPSGNIYAAGQFTNAGSAIDGDRYVAKWDGTKWSALVGLSSPAYVMGVYTTISCVSSDAAGNIYAGGSFKNSKGNAYVAKWNGSAWSELGGLNGLPANTGVMTIFCDMSTVNIYAAVYFTNGTSPYWGVAKWNGTSWSELGGTNGIGVNGSINSICKDGAGNIYAGGSFNNSSGKSYVAKWNGTAWSELGGLNGLAANHYIYSICSDPAGNIYAAGRFTNGANPDLGKGYVAKWNGTVWSETGGLNGLAANDYIWSLISNAGKIYATGSFFNTDGKGYVAKWNDTTWSELGGQSAMAANSTTYSLCNDKAGNIYAAGESTNASGKYYIAKYGKNTVGVKNVEPVYSFTISPNPSTGNFTATFPNIINKGSIEIYTILGEQVLIEPIILTSKKDFHLQNILPGIYFIKVNDGEKEYFRKIVFR